MGAAFISDYTVSVLLLLISHAFFDCHSIKDSMNASPFKQIFIVTHAQTTKKMHGISASIASTIIIILLNDKTLVLCYVNIILDWMKED